MQENQDGLCPFQKKPDEGHLVVETYTSCLWKGCGALAKQRADWYFSLYSIGSVLSRRSLVSAHLCWLCFAVLVPYPPPTCPRQRPFGRFISHKMFCTKLPHINRLCHTDSMRLQVAADMYPSLYMLRWGPTTHIVHARRLLRGLKNE